MKIQPVMIALKNRANCLSIQNNKQNLSFNSSLAFDTVNFSAKKSRGIAAIASEIQNALSDDNKEKAAKSMQFFWSRNNQMDGILERYANKIHEANETINSQEYKYEIKLDNKKSFFVNKNTLTYRDEKIFFQTGFKEDDEIKFSQIGIIKKSPFEQLEKTLEAEFKNGNIEQCAYIISDFYKQHKGNSKLVGKTKIHDTYFNIERKKVIVKFNVDEFLNDKGRIIVNLDTRGDVYSYEAANIEKDGNGCIRLYSIEQYKKLPR